MPCAVVAQRKNSNVTNSRRYVGGRSASNIAIVFRREKQPSKYVLFFFFFPPKRKFPCPGPATCWAHRLHRPHLGARFCGQIAMAADHHTPECVSKNRMAVGVRSAPCSLLLRPRQIKDCRASLQGDGAHTARGIGKSFSAITFGR